MNCNRCPYKGETEAFCNGLREVRTTLSDSADRMIDSAARIVRDSFADDLSPGTSAQFDQHAAEATEFVSENVEITHEIQDVIDDTLGAIDSVVCPPSAEECAIMAIVKTNRLRFKEIEARHASH